MIVSGLNHAVPSLVRPSSMTAFAKPQHVGRAVALISPAGPEERGMPHCGVIVIEPGSPT